MHTPTRLSLPKAVTAMVGLGLLTTVGTAQGAAKTSKAAPASATLAQAVVVEVYQHNLGKAIEMYRKIAGDKSQKAGERTEAKLRLAQAYRKLGQNAQADAMLKQAADGTGEAATRAAKILSGEVQDDGDLVKAKVQQALRAMRLTGKRESGDLSWIGQPAVPYIIEALDAEKADLQFITNASSVVLRLGGAKVEKWLDATRASKDVLRKRAVIRAANSGLDPSVRPALERFFEGTQPLSVRREVAGFGIRSPELLLQGVEDKDSEVRRLSLFSLISSWRNLNHTNPPMETLIRALPALGRERRRDAIAGRNGLWAWVSGADRTWSNKEKAKFQKHGPFSPTLKGCARSLEVMASDAFVGAKVKWPGLPENVPANALLDEVRSVLNALDRGAESGFLDQGVFAKSEAGRSFLGALWDLLPSWNREALPTVAKVLRLRVRGDQTLVDWVAKNASAGDLKILEDLMLCDPPLENLKPILDCFVRLAPPDAATNTLIRVYEQQPESRRVVRQRTPGRRGNTRESIVVQVLESLRAVGTDKAHDFIIARFLASQPKVGARVYSPEWNVVTKVTRSKSETGKPNNLLGRMASYKGGSESAASMRREALNTLVVSLTEADRPEWIAEAYRLGVGAEAVVSLPGSPRTRGRVRATNRSSTANSRGLQSLLVRKPKGASIEQVVRVLKLALARGGAVAFSDLAVVMKGRFSAREKAAYGAVLADSVLKVPEFNQPSGTAIRAYVLSYIFENFVQGEKGLAVTLAALRGSDDLLKSKAVAALRIEYRKSKELIEVLKGMLPNEDYGHRVVSYFARFEKEVEGVRPFAIRWLDGGDSRHTQVAVDYLLRFEPARIQDNAKKLLKHSDSYVRNIVARRLLERFGADVLDLVGPYIYDESNSVYQRKQLVTKIGATLDPRAVPHLLQAMKVAFTRAEARKQLDTIRFYINEKRHWDKVMSGSGFGAASTAEALIKQAGSKDTKVRVAAIQSLGTLGAPEALPFLIRWMTDPDKKVAAAASAAVTKINNQAPASKK